MVLMQARRFSCLPPGRTAAIMQFMRIALFCPFTQGPTRGNITSVQRISKHLVLHGCQVDCICLDMPDIHEQLLQLSVTPPDILHAFHAFHAGATAREVAHQLNRPYLITLTGSDLFDPAFRDHADTTQAIKDAAAVTCFDPLMAALASRSFPLAATKLTVIPQGVEPFPEARPLKRPADAIVILLPAALRPVKGIDWAIDQLAPLVRELPKLELWIAGGTLDTDYVRLIQSKTAALPWVKMLGEVPHQEMGAVYATADVVLNSSLFEGGMANTLLEAMAMGKPVMARDIPGNRSLIQHGETGWLYESGEQLCQLLRSFAQQPGLSRTIGLAAQTHVLDNFSPDHEASALVQLYNRLVRQSAHYPLSDQSVLQKQQV